MEILQIPGAAVRGDCFTVVGKDFPPDARIVFDPGGADLEVGDLVRPHLIYVNALPAALAAGNTTVLVRSASQGGTAAQAVAVTSGPPPAVRVLNPGAPTASPFTLAFVANPVYRGTNQFGQPAFFVDPVLSNRNAYLGCLAFCLENLFADAEDLLYADGIDSQIRLVSIFDPTKGTSSGNALAMQYALGNSFGMQPWPTGLANFRTNYGVEADVVFALHANTAYPRAAAQPTDDDPTSAGVPFTYDNLNLTHRRGTRNPGGLALCVNESRTGVTPAHEFGHAFSAYQSGFVCDLYNDAGGLTGGVNINLKRKPGNPPVVPATFATLDGVSFAAEGPGGGTGENRSNWVTFHPRRRDPNVPAVMDNYWAANANARNCLHDGITRAYLRDRLAVKLSR